VYQSVPDPGKYLIRQIFHDHRDEIRSIPSLSDTQKSAALLISMCKTEELGFNASLCPNCGIQLHYASCNNRNCPCCQWPSQQGWIAQRENEVIPEIPYYHVILTVPHDLNPLIRLNEKLLLGKLFSCSSQAVIDLSKDRHFLGAVPGIVSVLHTWRQDLLPHYHVHMIVSGGGLNHLGQFISQNDPSRNRKKKPEYEGGFFLPMPALMKLFRGKLMAAVKGLWKKNLLVLPKANIYTDPNGWAAFCEKLYTTKWVGNIVRTFNGNGNAIEYLARYTFRTAISNSRIMDYDGETVTFSVTNRDTREKESVRLPAMKFIRRFLSHVLPKGFTRVRYSGFLSNAWKTRKLQSIHRQRHLTAYVPSPLTGASKRELFLALWNTDISVCKCCGAQLIHLPRGQPIH
jgi:hypothetical protein